jgi:hypothetical protein
MREVARTCIFALKKLLPRHIVYLQKRDNALAGFLVQPALSMSAGTKELGTLSFSIPATALLSAAS